ncbi:ATP-dependent Clp protease proteolytic subunit [Undibacterium sp. CY18W]|uniref:ATP-dependent Clp protease proteolytic subunit n=2 Tax=Undibacterium hunanense TaxID=2762292 RepID=A0ABR6ZYT7_9BURK|nr:ATP-dependent Clp protease proteolytic subunit [Undibacterium hunanense]
MQSKLKQLFAFFTLCTILLSGNATAMTMLRSNQTLILFGKVVPEDSQQFRKKLEEGPVKTVVMTESPGGDMRAAYAIADLITEGKMNTAVNGSCMSACALIFMAGTERQMLASKHLEKTRLGFHGPHNKRTKEIATASIPRFREWLLKVTQGQFPEEVLDRALNIERAGDMMFFYYPNQNYLGDIRFCTEGSLRCETLNGYNIVKIGILTTTDLLKVESLDEPYKADAKSE